jgi:hypothetical protein
MDSIAFYLGTLTKLQNAISANNRQDFHRRVRQLGRELEDATMDI